MKRLAILLIAASMLAACGGGGGGAVAPPTGVEPTVPAGKQCSDVLTQPEEGAEHIADSARGTYKVAPPTSGAHWAKWADAGVYDAPIPDERQVHNLEHGHVIVQHNNLTEDELRRVRQTVEGDPRMMEMAPRPSLKAKLALTSWLRIQVCNEVPADVEVLIRDFVAQNRDSGVAPESVP